MYMNWKKVSYRFSYSKVLAILVLALGLMVCPAELAGAAPMGTAFAYQGRRGLIQYPMNEPGVVTGLI